VQFLGAKWFFGSYDARPTDLLDVSTARIWSGVAADLLTGKHRHLEDARWAEIYPSPGSASPISTAEFRAVVEEELARRSLPVDRVAALWPGAAPADGQWRRGEACLFFYHLLQK